MIDYLFDILFVLVTLATACFISRQQFVHAASSLIAVLIASLFAIGSFEAVTLWTRRTIFLPVDDFVTIYLWSVVAIGIFVVVCGALHYGIKEILPYPPEIPHLWETLGSWISGLLAGYLFAAFLLTVVHTFPASRDFSGAFKPERLRRTGPIMAFAPDYQFLTLTEYVCDHATPLARGKWVPDRPINTAELDRGRWSSFPIRFALWRELHQQRRNEAKREKRQQFDEP